MDSSSNAEEGKRNYTTFEVRPYKLTELARIYHINIQTFKRWIKRLRRKLGEIIGHYLTITQVEIVIAHLKLPYFVKIEVTSEEQFDHVLEEKMKRLPEQFEKASKKTIPVTSKTKKAVNKKRPAIKKRSAKK